MSGGIMDISAPITKTATGAVLAAAGFFKGFILSCDGTNDVTLVFHDNAAAASGTKLAPSMVFDGTAGPYFFIIPAYIQCLNGIYVTITCTGTCECTVYCRKR